MPSVAADIGSLPVRLLRLAFKIIAGALAVVLLALLLGFIAWDVLYFQPQRPQIAQLIASATDEERNPPETIVRLVRAASGQHVAAAAYRVLVSDPTNPTDQTRMRMLQWHMRGLLWWVCLSLHLSEQEQIALIASRSYMGREMLGFSAASQAIFNRPLALLSIEEAATLVAIPHCPNCFHNKRRGWDRRRDWLLSRLQAGP